MTNRKRAIPGKGKRQNPSENNSPLPHTNSQTADECSTELTMENMTRMLESIESTEMDLSSDTSKKSFSDNSSGNFYKLNRPVSVANQDVHIAGYDSDSSHGSSGQSNSCSEQSEVVVNFVFDSDDSSSEGGGQNDNDSDVSGDERARSNPHEDFSGGAEEQIASSESTFDEEASYTLSVPRWVELEHSEIGYVIEVDYTNNKDLSWTCIRTFSQLYEWYTDMGAALKQISLPFPPLEHSATPTKATQLNETRRQAMNIYFREVSRNGTLKLNPILLAFLNPDKPPDIGGDERPAEFESYSTPTPLDSGNPNGRTYSTTVDSVAELIGSASDGDDSDSVGLTWRAIDSEDGSDNDSNSPICSRGSSPITPGPPGHAFHPASGRSPIISPKSQSLRARLRRRSPALLMTSFNPDGTPKSPAQLDAESRKDEAAQPDPHRAVYFVPTGNSNLLFTSTNSSAGSPGSSTTGFEYCELELCRGVFLAGVVLKWPTRCQNVFGRMTKRLLVLKGNTLSYYSSKTQLGLDMLTPIVSTPATGSASHSSSYSVAKPKYTLSLSDTTTIARSKCYWRDCVEIVALKDTMWFKVPRGPGSNSTNQGTTEESGRHSHLRTFSNDGADRNDGADKASMVDDSLEDTAVPEFVRDVPSPTIACTGGHVSTPVPAVAQEVRWIQEISKACRAFSSQSTGNGCSNGHTAYGHAGSSSSKVYGCKRRARVDWFHNYPTAELVAVDAIPWTQFESSVPIPSLLVASLILASGSYYVDLHIASTHTASEPPPPSACPEHTCRFLLSHVPSPQSALDSRLNSIIIVDPTLSSPSSPVDQCAANTLIKVALTDDGHVQGVLELPVPNSSTSYSHIPYPIDTTISNMTV